MDNKIHSMLPEWHVTNKRVFLRADLNVPIDNTGTIIDDFRLRAILPTIDHLLSHKATVILATHLGRPKAQEPLLSTKQLVAWFKQQGYHIEFVPELNKALLASKKSGAKIILLENMRFFPGEKKQSETFAQKLKILADFYVNDAFALLHRTDTSITLLPKLFAPDKRTIGPLVEQELRVMGNIRFNPAHPYMLIIGGGKVKDKLPYLEHFLNYVNTIAICPALVFTLAKAQGKPVGKSLVDEEAIPLIEKIIKIAREKNISILQPSDYLIALNTFDGPLSYCSANAFPDDAIGISIGPETINEWKKEIDQANTLVCNAGMGLLNRPETITPLKDLLQVIANSSAYTIVGGGQSVAVVKQYYLDYGIDHLSTGGGAMLAYLSGKSLPGIESIL